MTFIFYDEMMAGMKNSDDRMSLRGKGLLRLWAERQIYEGGLIPAVQLVAAARSHSLEPIQVTVPRSIILGLGTHTVPEEARLYGYLGVTLEEVEQIGGGDYDTLTDVALGWSRTLTGDPATH